MSERMLTPAGMHSILEPAFQPILHSISLQTYAYEALLRLKGGMHNSPQKMINRWEASGYIAFVDSAMLTAIINAVRSSKGAPRVTVNVSIATIEIAGDAYFENLTLLQPYVRRLVVELTESYAITHINEVFRFIEKCKARKFYVAFDDCSPKHQYANVDFLRATRPEIIKIAGWYLNECMLSHDGGGMDDFISDLRRQKTHLVAEGICSPEHAEYAIALGAEFLQGNVLGFPARLPEKDRSPEFRASLNC